MRVHSLLLSCCSSRTHTRARAHTHAHTRTHTHTHPLSSDRLASGEHINKSLLRQLIAWGNETVLNMFFSAFWTPVSSLRLKKGQTRCSVGGQGHYNCMYFLSSRVQSAGDKLCGETYDLASSFADEEACFCLRQT